jgi:predicted nucleotidyltransferase
LSSEALKYLDTNEKKAVDEFTQSVKAAFGDSIKRLLIYGSKARGNFHKESDIDILVLLEQEDYQARNQISDIAFDLLLKYGVLISPRVINTIEYAKLCRWQTAFIRNVDKDGVPI